MIEEKTNDYGQKQIINNLDTVVKIEGKFLQIRLIRTQKWQGEGFTAPMPRARFIKTDINPQDDFSYIITKKDLNKLLNRE